MNIIDGMIEELKHEAASTRRVLERLPDDRLDFKPHEKSFTLGALSSHVANALMWAVPTCQMDHFVFDKENWKPWLGSSNLEITTTFDVNLTRAVDAMTPMSNEDLLKTWTMTDTLGNTFLSMPRVQVLRAMILNHMIHHRGQLTVYLRMCDVPVPAIYGPSADEQR
jgi:uncharacterized damage-inducible protein DinB